MSAYKEWAGGRVKVTPTPPKKPDVHAYVEGRFIFYTPTFYPSPDVKEWGARWDGTKKAWRLPRLARMVKKIQDYDPDAKLAKNVIDLQNPWESRVTRARQRLSEFTRRHPSFRHLYTYQHLALEALLLRGLHGIMLALSPGLGKTPTATVGADLYARKHTKSSPRFLVVCPRLLVPNWSREIDGPLDTPGLPKRIAKHGWSEHDGEVTIVTTANRDQAGATVWTVTHPEVLFERARQTPDAPLRITGQLSPEFDRDWDVLIVDESVLYKHRKSKRSLVMKSLSRHAEVVWELSGAPVTKDNSDIWQQFNIMEPDYFSSFWTFANEFCVVQRTQWSQGEILGSRHGIHLREEYPDLMFVRNQDEVLPDLPEYIYDDVLCPLTKRQKKAHDDLMDIWLHELDYNADSRVEVTAVIAQLTRLQQVTSNLRNLETTGQHWPDESSKADMLCAMLEAGAIEFPALVWTLHRPGGQALYERLAKMSLDKKSNFFGKTVGLVRGGTKGADELIQRYKSGDLDVLIMSIGVGKYGHTLTVTKTVCYFDKTWDSDAWFQSLWRVRRNGLKHRPRLLTFRARGTVDDFVEMNLAGKLPDMAHVTGARLAGILRSLGEEYIEDLEEEA